MATNIAYINRLIVSINDSNEISISIKNILIKHLQELNIIIADINTTLIEPSNYESYISFSNKSWKLSNSIEEYNKYIARIFYTLGKEINGHPLYLKSTNIFKINDMQNIIPNETTSSLIKDKEGNYNYTSNPITINTNIVNNNQNIVNDKQIVNDHPHIFILPGSADTTQTLDRVHLCMELINEFKKSGKLISHIIVSGRGNGANEDFIPHINKQKENSNLPIRFLIPSSFDKANVTDLVKYGELSHERYPPLGFTHFKTEAYYMAIEVYKQLQTIYQDGEEKPKIFIEPLALETAANFVLSPFSCFYEYIGGDASNDIISNLSDNETNDTNVSTFFDTLLHNNIHIVSHDYHILRCINTSIQTLRPSLSQEIVNEYGDISYYTVRDISISENYDTNGLFALNYFDSFTQPYGQLFFDMKNIEAGHNIKYKYDNTIVFPRTTTKLKADDSPYIYLFQLVIRLLTYHGVYANNSSKAANGYRFSNLVCKVYPNILVCNINPVVKVGGYLNIKNKTKTHKHKKTNNIKNKTKNKTKKHKNKKTKHT